MTFAGESDSLKLPRLRFYLTIVWLHFAFAKVAPKSPLSIDRVLGSKPGPVVVVPVCDGMHPVLVLNVFLLLTSVLFMARSAYAGRILIISRTCCVRIPGPTFVVRY